MRLGGLKGAALVGLCTAAMPVGAETLRDALVSAYNTNPTLTGSRAGQRAVDENVAIAKAGARPTLGGNGVYTENLRTAGGFSSQAQRQVNASLSASLPIYQGGRVRNSIRAAELRVEAGRANLRSDESSVFQSVVTAYMDVIRDQSIVELNANNVKVLETNLQATRDRFQVGDLTRTDVAQSEARLAIAQSQLEGAQAQLIASREAFLQVVGHPAASLDPPPPLPPLPSDPGQAVAIAIANNPNLLSVQRASQAAHVDVATARAARLPQLSAVADGSYINYLGSINNTLGAFNQSGTTASAGAQLTLPLYQGGLPSARVRQAQANESQQIELVVEVERGIIAQTRAALSSYAATLAVINSSETAVSANELALEGVRAEQSVGTRNVLDVLNAEQELLSSRVQLVTARHDSYVAGFALLAALGRAEARDLNLDGLTLYDPQINYQRVRGKAGDWSDDSRPQTQATRTVDEVVGPLGPVLSPPGQAATPSTVPADARPAGPPQPTGSTSPTPPEAQPTSRQLVTPPGN
jgi:outer membrane protein